MRAIIASQGYFTRTISTNIQTSTNRSTSSPQILDTEVYRWTSFYLRRLRLASNNGSHTSLSMCTNETTRTVATVVA